MSRRRPTPSGFALYLYLHGSVSDPLHVVPCKALAIKFGGAMASLYALAAICHPIKVTPVSGLRWPSFDEATQQSTYSWQPR